LNDNPDPTGCQGESSDDLRNDSLTSICELHIISKINFDQICFGITFLAWGRYQVSGGKED